MKKVISHNRRLCNEIVYSDNPDANKYYGVCFKNTHERGFIVQRDFDKGVFRVLSADGCTRSNHFFICGKESFPTLGEALTTISESSDHGVFEFDSYQELFKWLLAN